MSARKSVSGPTFSAWEAANFKVFDGKHPFTFHACRRTFMSLLEAEGVPRELIGALAGHAGKGVADRHYIAKNLKRFDQAVSTLPLPTAGELGWLQ